MAIVSSQWRRGCIAGFSSAMASLRIAAGRGVNRGLAIVSANASSIVQIIEIVPPGPAEEEVLADVPERPFDLALGLGPWPDALRLETVSARLETVIARARL